jgi:mannose-1-phosphate guanylyltransferase/mannose-6-phosphate isomerase
MEFSNFTVGLSATIIEALEKIDLNQKGFLVVLDEDDHVVGTLTDVDIRRAFIKGKDIHFPIAFVYMKNCKILHIKDGISKAIELFKNGAINFLPIVDDEKRLVNIITKKQMHSLLLQDIHADLKYNFQYLDEDIVDHEIFQRPWGFYKTTVMNNYFQSKVISVNPESQLSLQSHDHREEHWIVAHGIGTVQLDDSVLAVHCGSSVFIPKGTRHRLTNTDEKESLIIIEVQLGDYFGEDDIHRYEDIYGRT